MFCFNLYDNPKRSVILSPPFLQIRKIRLLKLKQLAQSQMANRLSWVSNSGLPCSKACALKCVLLGASLTISNKSPISLYFQFHQSALFWRGKNYFLCYQLKHQFKQHVLLKLCPTSFSKALYFIFISLAPSTVLALISKCS